MINIAEVKVAKKSFSSPKLAAPLLSRVQLISIEKTCGYYGWSFKYSAQGSKSRLTLIIDNVLHEVKVKGRDFIAFNYQSGETFNFSEYIKMSGKLARAGIFPMPKKITEDSIREMLFGSIEPLVRIIPQLQLHGA